ncbi:MAG TPA: universal stress protein [Candidatus Nitrosotenuis sp.]|nr:universal stress protein [Candidatus Nitrosotenuis sp.]
MAEQGQIICTSVDDCSVAPTTLIKHILVPFDNSGHALRAFGHALDLARRYGADITVVTVTDEDQNAEWVNDTPSRQKTVNISRNAEFRRLFLSLGNQARKFGVHFDSIILESTNTALSIISLASQKRIDYIVMGTHGHGKTKEMMLGRVSTSVALNAHCPVVLIK